MTRAMSATLPSAAVSLEARTLRTFAAVVDGVALELGTRKARALVALLRLATSALPFTSRRQGTTLAVTR